MTAPPLSRLDDADIIERSWQDAESFADLFDRHAAVLHRYVARRLGGPVVDDVVSETFLTAFRRRHSYDLSRREALPWLYGIAANVMGRYRRDEVRLLRALARTGLPPDDESHADRVDAAVCASAGQRDLAAALADLADRDRDVLLLIAWADLSYEEVSRALQIPVGTVRSRLNRARRRVRQALGGHNPSTTSEEPCHD